jgi:hypothetical protein
LDGGGASAGERVEHPVAGFGQAVDKEAGELRFEAGAVADLVDAMAAALAGGPEGVDEIAQPGLFQRDGRGAVEGEPAQGVDEVG